MMKAAWPKILNSVSPAAWGWGVSALVHLGTGAALVFVLDGWSRERPRSFGSQAGIALEATLRGSHAQQGDAIDATPAILVQAAAPPHKVETFQRVREPVTAAAAKQSIPAATDSALPAPATAPPQQQQTTPEISTSQAEQRPRQMASIAAPNVLVVAPDVVGTDVDRHATPWANRPPLYPDQAILERREGVVLLRITISPAGKVTQVEIARSSTHSILDASAVRAARSWRFEPARENGAAVESVETQEIRFELRD